MTEPRPKATHRIEFLLYRAAEAILGSITMEDCVHFGRLVGGALYAFSGRYRRLVRRNLRIATAGSGLSEKELDRLVRETFRRGGANFLASFKTQTMPVDELTHHIRPDAFAILRANTDAGRGTVVAMAHMGNWEALTRLGSALLESGSYGGIYRPLNNPLIDELTHDRRTSTGACLFSRKDGFHAPSAFLKSGGALAVLGDQRAGGRGTAMPFLGKMTTCPPLLELLARRGKAAVVALQMRSHAPDRWELDLRPLEGDGSTATIIAGIETAIRASLADVFWFHDRWRTDSSRPLSFFTRLDPAIAATATVPLRLVMTTPDDAPESDIARFIDRLLTLRPDLRIERIVTSPLTASDPRVAHHEWDPTTPPEHADSLLERIDASHPAPIDGFLLFGSEIHFARAARRGAHRVILGLDVSGKPWSRSFPRPADTEGWIAIADAMALVPARHRSA